MYEPERRPVARVPRTRWRCGSTLRQFSIMMPLPLALKRPPTGRDRAGAAAVEFTDRSQTRPVWRRPYSTWDGSFHRLEPQWSSQMQLFRYHSAVSPDSALVVMACMSGNRSVLMSGTPTSEWYVYL